MSVRVASDSTSASLSAENRAVLLSTSAMDAALLGMRKSRLGTTQIHGANPFDHIAPRIALSPRAHAFRNGEGGNHDLYGNRRPAFHNPCPGHRKISEFAAKHILKN